MPQLHLDVTPAGPGGSIYALMEDCSAENECIHIGHAIMDLRYHEGGTEYQNIILIHLHYTQFNPIPPRRGSWRLPAHSNH